MSKESCRIQTEFENKKALLTRIDEALTALDCQELFEDHASELLQHYRTTIGYIRSLEDRIRKSIPLQCSCGSFQFYEKKICSLSNEEPGYLFLFVYHCIKCGTEMRRER